MFGDAKSSIWLFRMIPVEGDMNLQPQIKLTEAVTETASPSGERKLCWQVPWSSVRESRHRNGAGRKRSLSHRSWT